MLASYATVVGAEHKQINCSTCSAKFGITLAAMLHIIISDVNDDYIYKNPRCHKAILHNRKEIRPVMQYDFGDFFYAKKPLTETEKGVQGTKQSKHFCKFGL